jgi:hypothetical protein
MALEYPDRSSEITRVSTGGDLTHKIQEATRCLSPQSFSSVMEDVVLRFSSAPTSHSLTSSVSAISQGTSNPGKCELSAALLPSQSLCDRCNFPLPVTVDHGSAGVAQDSPQGPGTLLLLGQCAS